MDSEKLDELRKKLDEVREELRSAAGSQTSDRLVWPAISALDIAHDLLSEVRYGSR